MLIPHKGHTDTIQVYSVTVMTHVKALQAGHSSQGTSEPITPGPQTRRRTSATGSVPPQCIRGVWKYINNNYLFFSKAKPDPCGNMGWDQLYFKLMHSKPPFPHFMA